MYSFENFFNFNKTDTSQWYNITITRELTQFEIINPTSNGPNGGGEPPFDPTLIILIISCVAGAIVALVFLARYVKAREPKESRPKKTPKEKPIKPPKKPLKHNPKLQERR